MRRSQFMTILSAGVAVSMISLLAAAPPKTGSAKKKPADSSAATDDDDMAAAKDDQVGDGDDSDKPKKVVKTDAEWRKILTPAQFKVARKKGTEIAFGPAYNKFKKEGEGIYKCVCC